MLVDGDMTLRRTHCYTSVKGLHKHIDMGRLPALAALVVSREKTMGVCQEFCVNRFNKQHRIAA